MKSVIFSILVLFFMLPVILAVTNKCYKCHAVNSESCKEEEEECLPGCACVTISEEFGTPGNTYRSISKGCAPYMNNNTLQKADTSLGVYVTYFRKYCEGDRCNSHNFEIPTNQAQGKGIVCPVCYEFNTLNGCEAKNFTTCAGEDYQCVYFRGTMKKPCGENVDFSAQGCSSKDMCHNAFNGLVGLQIINMQENRCYIPPLPLNVEYNTK